MIDVPGVNEFIDLSDAPHSYVGQTGKVVKVNATETAVEFGTGGGGSSITLQTNGTSNGSQTLLNLKQGANVIIADDGFGGVTITSSGGSGIPATTVTNETYGATGVVGVATSYAREDHIHGMPASTKDTTTITGILKGNGAVVSSATAGTDYVSPNVAIVAGTATKITYDAKGLVTVGASATTADIADSLNKRYVTDANLTTIGNQSGTNTGDNAVNTTYASDYRAANFIAGTNYQAPITLTTTGSSGASTLIGNTLNIPNYAGGGSALTTQDEGVTLSTSVTTLNFTGAGVTASGAGATTTINIPGGSGSFAVTSAEVDFGSVPVRSKRITVTDAAITSSSKIMITPNGAPATERVGNDWEWDSIAFSAVPGTGNFILTGTASGRIKGKRKIYYTYS